MSAEEVKDAVKRYCLENYPGREWCAGVHIRVGEIRDANEEMLLVLPPDMGSTGPPSVVLIPPEGSSRIPA